MKLTGPNPPACFLTLPCSGLKPLHPSQGPRPPLFSTIIPCWSRHCQSKGLQGRKAGEDVYGHVCFSKCVCVWVTWVIFWVWMCLHAQTTHITYLYTCKHVHGAIKWELGDFQQRRWLLQTIWEEKVKALGLDLGLGVISNTWTLYEEGDEETKEQRGGGP